FALPSPRCCDLLEPKRKPALFGFGAERPSPVEIHGAPSGKILWRPLHFRLPEVFLAVAGFAAADYPADSIQINLRRDVFEQRFATKEPDCFGMHGNSAQVVDSPECLVASDRSAEPHVRIAFAPIGREALDDAVRPFGKDQIDQV